MSESYTHGIGKLQKPSTRVIHTPGGSSSLNLFSSEGPDESKPVNQCQAARSKSSVFSTGSTPEKAKPAMQYEPQECKPATNGNSSKSSTRVLNPPGGQSSFNLFDTSGTADAPITRGAPNPYEHKTDLFGGEAPINGSKPRQQQPEEEYKPANKNKSSTRVLNPPGGQTSVNLFGGSANDDTANAPITRGAQNPYEHKTDLFGGEAPANGKKASSSPQQHQAEEEENKPGNQTKSSTRVLNPPGGQSSVNLFSGSSNSTDNAPITRGAPNPYEHKTDLFGGDQASNARPTSARRQPPGGASHNIFG